MRRALLGFLPGEASDLMPFDHVVLAATTETFGAFSHRVVADVPVASAVLLDGHVEDGACDVVREPHFSVEEFVQDEGFSAPLLEPAHVQHAGRDDLARVERDHSRDGQKHAASAQDFHDHSNDTGLMAIWAENHDDIAKFAHLIARGVEYSLPNQSGEEDPAGRNTHEPDSTVR